MASSHNAIQDLTDRVVWDSSLLGEFSRQNSPIFASLTGRQFDVLDCHSNGAMICLAALFHDDTKAKKVRLFGPQINEAAARHWSEWAKRTGGKIEIYINNGDPIPAISWKQPSTQLLQDDPIAGFDGLADALMYTWKDRKFAVMDKVLENYGFKVTRFNTLECGISGIECHSMLLYEKNTGFLQMNH
jgi:hypothetical protein